MIRPIFLLLLLGLVPAWAGELPQLSLAKIGEPLIAEDFEHDGLAKGWTVAKGKWEVKDGALVGSEVAADKHAAVLACQTPNHDSVLQFDFELRGAKSLALSMNHAKGHLWRVTITPNGASLIRDKDKRDAASKMEVISQSAVKLDAAKRYTLTAEIVAGQVAVRIGDAITLSAMTPAFDVDKPNVRFVMAGDSVAIDNVRMWAATAK